MIRSYARSVYKQAMRKMQNVIACSLECSIKQERSHSIECFCLSTRLLLAHTYMYSNSHLLTRTTLAILSIVNGTCSRVTHVCLSNCTTIDRAIYRHAHCSIAGKVWALNIRIIRMQRKSFCVKVPLRPKEFVYMYNLSLHQNPYPARN